MASDSCFSFFIFLKRSSIRSSAKEEELNSDMDGEQGLCQVDRVRGFKSSNQDSLLTNWMQHIIFMFSGSEAVDDWIRSNVGAGHRNVDLSAIRKPNSLENINNLQRYIGDLTYLVRSYSALDSWLHILYELLSNVLCVNVPRFRVSQQD